MDAGENHVQPPSDGALELDLREAAPRPEQVTHEPNTEYT
jgi:hypothetical protein